ncbi:MAG TPA: hypothetical protein VIZ28_15925 [Chitinophagaceae bacterium]
MRIILLFPLILVSSLIFAQPEGPDTLPPLMQEPVTENPEEPPTEIIEENYTEEPEERTNIYFLRKELQANGGGPDSVAWKKLPDSLIKRLRSDNDFWYVNYVFNKEKREQNKTKQRVPLAQTPVFQTILWLLIIGGFAAFVIIYLSNSNVSLFRKKNTFIRTGEEMDGVTDNIFEINYQREIDKAVSNGNYRFAVRLMFLQVLKGLSDKNIIRYTPDRTNFEYLLQLQSTRHYNDFFRLTRNYEYSWYGQFDIDTEKFSLIRKEFENFDLKLK